MIDILLSNAADLFMKMQTESGESYQSLHLKMYMQMFFIPMQECPVGDKM